MAARKMTFTSVRDEEFIISEAQGRRSREQILLHSLAERLQAGTVIGKVTKGALTAGAVTYDAGNAGNGVMAAAPTVDAGVAAGVYIGEYIDADTFVLRGPGGFEQHGAQGVAFNGPVNFTHNVGGAPNAAGDIFRIPVAMADGHGRYVQFDPAATDGSEVPAGFNCITEDPLDPVGHVRTSGFMRDGEVNGHKIFWPDGITQEQQATAEAQLAHLQGILVRY